MSKEIWHQLFENKLNQLESQGVSYDKAYDLASKYANEQIGHVMASILDKLKEVP